jgi:cell division protein FtsX
MWWWIGIALFFVFVIALFLLGIYLIVKKVGDKVADVPKDVVKEGFTLLKDKLNERKNGDTGKVL